MPTKPAVDDDHVSVEVTETVVKRSRSRVFELKGNAAAVVIVVIVVVGIIFGFGVLTGWGIWG